MLIEIEDGTLYLNGRSFCQVEDREQLGSGAYPVVAVSRDGNTYPYVVGADTIIHGEVEKDGGILVGEYIIDGDAIGSRAKIAHLVKALLQTVDGGGQAVLEVS